jgi:hypothetical protein
VASVGGAKKDYGHLINSPNMLINLWSTPRTGSTYYSFFLKEKYNAILINEFLNPYLMNKNKKNFYIEYYVENGTLLNKIARGKNKRTLEEEEIYRTELLKLIDFQKQNIVMHNHVWPIRAEAYSYLLENTETNIFIYRKDKFAQLASYAIAFSSKIFMLFSQKDQITTSVSDIEIQHLENLITRIKKYDSLVKSIEIAYEDIDFKEIPNFPVKQTLNHRNLLSKNMIEKIEILVKNYEKQTPSGQEI